MVAVAPSGACGTAPPLRFNYVTGDLFGCDSGTWTKIGGVGGGITGLTTNVIPKATSATSIGNSSVTDDGSTVTTTEPLAGLTLASGTSPPACTAGSAGVWCASEGTAATNVAGSALIYADSTAHEYLAKTNGASSAGILLRAQPGSIHQTAQTAAIPTATLCASAAGACNTAGTYQVSWSFIETGTACATPGTGGVTFLLTWTDFNGTAHSAIQLPMDDGTAINTVSGTFHFQTSLGAAWASGTFNISSNGSIIQYATGYTACGVGTGTYELDAVVTRIQ